MPKHTKKVVSSSDSDSSDSSVEVVKKPVTKRPRVESNASSSKAVKKVVKKAASSSDSDSSDSDKPAPKDEASHFMQVLMGAKSNLSPELAKGEVERLKLQKEKILTKISELAEETKKIKDAGEQIVNKHK